MHLTFIVRKLYHLKYSQSKNSLSLFFFRKIRLKCISIPHGFRKKIQYWQDKNEKKILPCIFHSMATAARSIPFFLNNSSSSSGTERELGSYKERWQSRMVYFTLVLWFYLLIHQTPLNYSFYMNCNVSGFATCMGLSICCAP